MPQRPERVEDGGDLIGTLLVLPPETGGQNLGVLPDGGQELADSGHLRGQFGWPIENDGSGGLRGGGVVAGNADFGLLGGGSAGGLVVGSQPADQAALFFRRPLMVERNKAREKLLFERLALGTATGEEVGERYRRWVEL